MRNRHAELFGEMQAYHLFVIKPLILKMNADSAAEGSQSVIVECCERFVIDSVG